MICFRGMSCYEGRGGEGIKLDRVKVFVCEEGGERERRERVCGEDPCEQGRMLTKLGLSNRVGSMFRGAGPFQYDEVFGCHPWCRVSTEQALLRNSKKGWAYQM